MSWKVLLTARTLDVVGASALAMMKEEGLEMVTPSRPGPLKAADLLAHLEGVDAVLASVDAFTSEVLESEQARSLKVISRWGVGYDAIDVPTATRQGIVIAYTPGLLNDAVADYAFALLLAVARQVHVGHCALREGRWKSLFGHDVAGKTLGIIGCGRIGQAVAKRAAGFDMRLLGFDISPHPAGRDLGIQYVPLDQLLRESDYVTLHAASSPDNRGLMGEEQFQLMKPSAFLINTARGALVDEAALVRALEGGAIAGAALDTFAVEPLAADHPFIKAPHLLLSPHQASFGRDTGERISLSAARAILELKQGKRPELVVNPEVFDLPALRAAMNG